MALTPDGTWELASAANNGVLRLWSLEGGGRGGGGPGQPAAARYTNAKVLLVGDSGVGKTGLARRMATGEFAETQSTDGHWATRLKASHHDDQWATRVMLNEDVTDEGTRREIWLWDFAGQAEYWMAHEYPVMLVIRTSNGHIRWLDATEYLKERKAAGDWPVTQIEFAGEDFSALNLLSMRRKLIGPPPDQRA